MHDRDLKTGLRFHPTNEAVAKHLSACGWFWQPDSRSWRKGEQGKHAISEEALQDILQLHPWAVPFIWRALQDGKTEIKVSVDYDGEICGAQVTVE